MKPPDRARGALRGLAVAHSQLVNPPAAPSAIRETIDVSYTT